MNLFDLGAEPFDAAVCIYTFCKKNYIYLNEYTMYVVEDITGTHTDPYHYKLYFHTDILPDVEVRS